MVNKPKILVIRENSDSSEQFSCEALESRGFTFDVSTVSEGPGNKAPSQHADAIIFELLGKSAAAASDAFLAHAKGIADESGDRKTPILVLCDAELADDYLQNDAIDGVMHPPLTASQIAGRVMALSRLNTMRLELSRRLETYARYGLDAPEISVPEAVGESTVLVVGDGSRFALIEQALARNTTIVGAFTRETAEDYLQRRPFDTVLLDTPIESTIEFLQQIRRNPRFHSLPVISLMSEADAECHDRLYDAGATDVFIEPVYPQDLAVKVTNYIQENRFREKLRAIYKQARHMATGDALTGLYSRGFALEHLDRIIKDRTRWGEALTICGLTIENLPEINGAFGYAVGDRIIRQIGTLIGQLVRGEDMTSRWKSGNFLIILTSTDAEDAKIAINRIRGVINHTMFSVEDVSTPIQVRVDTNLIGAEPNEMAESVAKRAFSQS